MSRITIFSLVLGISFWILSGPSFAQDVPFRRVEIDSAFHGDGKALGDIDGDGLLDILVGGQKLVWYRAPGWAKTILAEGVDFGTDIQVGDVDNDGDLDVIAPDSLARENVLWFENPRPRGDPSMAPWRKHVIGTFVGAGAPHPHDVAVGDIDGNGRLDAVTRRGRTAVWLQTGADAWTKVDLVNAVPGREGTALGDLDNDGDLDVVLNGYWMEAPAAKANGAAWVKHTIDPDWPADASVAVADLDRDGRRDVILARSEGAGGRLAWYAAANPKTGPWTAHEIGAPVDYVHTLESGDIDNDGNVDVIFAEMAQSTRKRVGFFRNGGNARSWTLQVIATTGAHNAAVGDIGADGDLDIMGSNWQGPPVQLWENLSSRRLSLDRWTYIQIDKNRSQRFFGLDAADLNGDGRKDIASGHYVYLNPGSDMTGTWRRVSLPSGHDALLALDVDGDVLADLISMTGDGTVYWLEASDPAAAGWLPTRIGSLPSADHRISSQSTRQGQVIAGGRPEILISVANQTYAFSIPARPASGNWPRVVVVENGVGVARGDIDGDGDLDLAGSYPGENGLNTKVAWWENPGNGSGNWPRHPVGEIVYRDADRFAIGDLDGDGRPDLLVTEEISRSPYRPAHLYWFKRPPDPRSPGWARTTVMEGYTLKSMDLADMDRDGDLDVITGEHRGTLQIVIWENDGKGNFTAHPVDAGKESHLGARVFDLDDDGDLDILSICWDTPEYLHLWRNDALGAGRER